MSEDHSDLAEAMDNLGTAISSVAASTPSGAPHAMVWVEKAKMAINAWRSKFMPQPEPVAEPEEPTADEAGASDDQPAEDGASDDQPAEDAPSDPPAWSPPAA